MAKLTGSNLTGFMVLVFLLAATLACNFSGDAQNAAGTGGSLVLDYFPSGQLAQGEFHELSPDQQERVRVSGYPDRFLILFYEEEDSQEQILPVRLETWSYDVAGMEFTFRNGSLIMEGSIKSDRIEGVGRTSYKPEMFADWMGLDELTIAVAQEGFYRQLIPDDPTPGRELIYFKGLVIGLQDDRIMYLETLPIGAAGLPHQEFVTAPGESDPEPQETSAAAGETTPAEPETTAAAEEVQDPAALAGIVIYATSIDTDYEIYSLDLQTGEEVNISSSPAEDVYAACSPLSGTIAFISDRSGTDQVYTVNPDGSGLQQVTQSSSSKDFLNWYSESELIYWQWDGDLENSYVLYNLSDGTETPVTEEVGKAYSVSIAVSPAAEWVASSEQREGQDYEIWVIEVASGTERQITSNDEADTNPVWSPDGSRLLYSSGGDLWSYDMQDGSTTQVTMTEGKSETSACWLGN